MPKTKRDPYSKFLRNDEPTLRRFRQFLWKASYAFVVIALVACFVSDPAKSPAFGGEWTPFLSLLYEALEIVFIAVLLLFLVSVFLYAFLCNLDFEYPGTIAFGASSIAHSKRAIVLFFNSAVRPNALRLGVVALIMASEFTLAFSGLLPARFGCDGAWFVGVGIFVTGLFWMRRVVLESASHPRTA